MSEWKVVPVEPTPEMLEAGRQALWAYHFADVYRAMLAAAPAAPAPEPVAWLIHMPDGAKMATTVWEAAEKAYEYGDSLLEPLYTHPAPAAPADATVEKIATLIDEYRHAVQQQDRDPRDQYKIQSAAECYAALRAEVEHIVRDRDEWKSAANAATELARHNHERAEAATARIATLEAALKEARVHDSLLPREEDGNLPVIGAPRDPVDDWDALLRRFITVTIDIPIPYKATHYAGDLLDEPTFYYCSQVGVAGDHWWYWDQKRQGWYLASHSVPHNIKRLSSS